jgi:TrmH family RNA methyltransferase
MKSISSRQHPVVRAFRELAADPDPAGARLLLDGVHQVREAWAAGATLEVVAVAAACLTAESEEAEIARAAARDGVEVVSVGSQAMDAMSPVRNPSGIVAIAHRRPATVADICARENAFVLGAVDVQDPGNLGALIRVAEAGGATGVLVCGASANPFSWKALRGSMGSAVRFPIAHRVDVMDAIDCARRSGSQSVAAVPRDGRNPDTVNWSGRVLLLLGGEGSGLSAEVVARCDERVTIPMAWPVDSLNVAVAAGVIIYAARRHGT